MSQKATSTSGEWSMYKSWLCFPTKISHKAASGEGSMMISLKCVLCFPTKCHTKLHLLSGVWWPGTKFCIADQKVTQSMMSEVWWPFTNCKPRLSSKVLLHWKQYHTQLHPANKLWWPWNHLVSGVWWPLHKHTHQNILHSYILWVTLKLSGEWNMMTLKPSGEWSDDLWKPCTMWALNPHQNIIHRYIWRINYGDLETIWWVEYDDLCTNTHTKISYTATSGEWPWNYLGSEIWWPWNHLVSGVMTFENLAQSGLWTRTKISYTGTSGE